MFLPRIDALPTKQRVITQQSTPITDERGRDKYILEVLDVIADLLPLSGVAGDITRAENSGDDGGDPSAVLGKPISLENADDGVGTLSGGLFRGDHRDLGEIGQCDGVDWGLLRVEVRRDQGVKLWAADQTRQSYWRRTQLLRVFLH